MKSHSSMGSMSLRDQLPNNVDELQNRLSEALETIEAIRSGSADALVGSGPEPNVLTLAGADAPYRLIVEMMGEGSVTLSSDGTILYCNDRFAEMVQLTHQQLVGSQFGDVLSYADQPKFDHMLGASPELTRREIIKLRRSSDEITTQITMKSLGLPGVEGVIVTVTDLSELEEARQAKDRFFASMSHELRTPLTSVLGYVSVVLGGVAGPLTEKQERQLSIVKRSGEHLLGLVNRLLDLAKIEAGEITIRLEPLSCGDMAQDVATMLRPLAETKGLSITVVAPSRDIIIQSDKLALNQILINLAGNSIKFTDTGEVKIEIHRRRTGDRQKVEFCVADTGRGIPLDVQTRLFESFRHMDSVHDIPTEGAGLGLYVSKRLAQLIGGRISFESVVGKGSRFILSIDGDAVDDLQRRAIAVSPELAKC